MKPWYEDATELRQKREELGVSAARLAKAVGRHRSWIEEIEAGRIALNEENGASEIWQYLAERQLEHNQIGLLSAALQAPK